MLNVQQRQQFYPEFEQDQMIEVKLVGKKEPISLSFVKWISKEDRPQSAFLIANHEGVVRPINDLHIESINGEFLM